MPGTYSRKALTVLLAIAAAVLCVSVAFYWMRQTDGLLALETLEAGERIQVRGLGTIEVPKKWWGDDQRMLSWFSVDGMERLIVLHAPSRGGFSCAVYSRPQPMETLLQSVVQSGVSEERLGVEGVPEDARVFWSDGSDTLRIFIPHEGRNVSLGLIVRPEDDLGDALALLLEIVTFDSE